MKTVKRIVSVLLLAGIMFTLAGCADESRYAEIVIRGNLDEVYKGIYDEEYLSLVELTEAKAKNHYRKRMKTEAEYLAYYWDMFDENVGDRLWCLDKEVQEELIELCEAIFSKTEYRVEDVVKFSDGSYAVKLMIYPVDVVYMASELYHNDEYEPLNRYWEKYENINLDEITAEERKAVLDEYNEIIMQMLWEQVDEAGYMEPQTLSVLIEKDEEGVQTILEEDWDRINKTLVYYP